MFFNDVKEIAKISGRTGCAIFVMPNDLAVEIPGALILKPVEKSVITTSAGGYYEIEFAAT